MRVVVSHLTLKRPLPRATVDLAEDACRRLVDAGGLAASFVKVDDTHMILILTFPDLDTEERIKSEIGGPWMRDHLVPLLEEPPERSSGTVVAGSI